MRQTEWMVAILTTVAAGWLHGAFLISAAGLTIPFPAANVSWLGAERGSVGDKQLVR
jgi:hypothetical protein